MSTEPTAEHIDAVARGVDPVAFDPSQLRSTRQVAVLQWAARKHMAREAATAILATTDPAVHAALAASLPAEVMLAALVDRGTLTEEWALRYERDLSAPTMSGETEATATMPQPNEARVRQAVKSLAPIGARNRRAVTRHATDWREVAP